MGTSSENVSLCKHHTVTEFKKYKQGQNENCFTFPTVSYANWWATKNHLNCVQSVDESIKTKFWELSLLGHPQHSPKESDLHCA